MGLFDKVAANLGIQTDRNADPLDLPLYARLPADHPVVLLADRAGERGLEAGDLEMRQLFGDPMGRDAPVPVAPRLQSQARYNWVARRTIDQMKPRFDENHVDRRIPAEIRDAMTGAIADSIDPFGDTQTSIVSIRMRDEAAMSKRIVGYLQASPDEIARRGVEVLSDASEDGLRAEFESVPGTARMRIPQGEIATAAWIEERARTEHALAKAGALPASAVLDAASRMDIVATTRTDGPLMETYVYPEIVKDAERALPDVQGMVDIDLRFRFKELGGMGSAQIPVDHDRRDWMRSMLVEERQVALLPKEERETLATERRSVEASLPPVQTIRNNPRMSASVVNAVHGAGF